MGGACGGTLMEQTEMCCRPVGSTRSLTNATGFGSRYLTNTADSQSLTPATPSSPAAQPWPNLVVIVFVDRVERVVDPAER